MYRLHGALYKSLNGASTRLLNRTGVPPWLTADSVTAGRLALVLPTLALASRGFQWVPASLVLANAALCAPPARRHELTRARARGGSDYVDGALARWQAQAGRDVRPAVAPGALQASLRREALARNWGAYFDAVADKVFAIPVWVGLGFIHTEAWLQVALAAHVLIEAASTAQRSYALLDDATTSAKTVTADASGKIKQFVSMTGTALLFVDSTHVAGGALLWAALPLAVVSLRSKLVAPKRVLVVLSQLGPEQVAFLASAKRQTGCHVVVACTGPDAAAVHRAALALGPLVSEAALQPDLSARWCADNAVDGAIAKDAHERDALAAKGVPHVRALAQ